MAKSKTSPRQIQITQIKSAIGYTSKAKATVRALGIRRMNQTVIQNDSPAIRGMITSINYLLKIKEL